jgi:hypothetical protein
MTTMSEAMKTIPTDQTSARRLGAVAGLAAGPLFLTIVAVLTLAERGMLHRYGWTFLNHNNVPWPSGLSLGRYGAAQIANFAVTGLLLLTFTRALSADLRGVTGRIATVLLTIQGAALAISAVPTDHQSMQSNGPDTWHGYVHDIAFFFVAIPSVLAPLFVAFALRRDRRWRPLAQISFIVPLLLVGVFAMQNAVGDLAFTLFLAVVFGWVALLGWRLAAEG